MTVRFAPPTCLLAPPCVRRPETTWMIEVDLVREKWVEVDEAVAGQLREPDVSP